MTREYDKFFVEAEYSLTKRFFQSPLFPSLHFPLSRPYGVTAEHHSSLTLACSPSLYEPSQLRIPMRIARMGRKRQRRMLGRTVTCCTG